MSDTASLAPLRGSTIGFIGSGTMGQALISGLLVKGVAPRCVWASDPTLSVRRQVKRKWHIRVGEDNKKIIEQADVVILAVKPHQLETILADIGPLLKRHQMVISIAAGIRLKWLQAKLPRIPLVRVMPNLPATVGKGFSAIAWGRGLSIKQKSIALAIFETVGKVAELPEKWFDAITAVSGSGPAYVFFLGQAWEQAAVSLGLPRKTAAEAIRQTLSGSAALAKCSDADFSELIARVASKRGTTQAALDVMGKRRIAAHLVEALRAAARRSRELSWS